MATSGSVPKLDWTKFYNVINGKLEETKTTRHSINPSTLEANPEVPVSTPEDVDRAVAFARKASVSWAKVPIAERQAAVSKFADAIEALTEDFAKMLTREQGKPIWAATAEVGQGPQFLRWFAGPKANLDEQVLEDSAERRVSVRYIPLGVAVGIVPWNFPVMLASGKIGPALVAGNAFILKPSPFTPYCDLKLAELAQNFFPPGVLQALSGDDNLGPWLTAHPGVDKVSFTGSSATGKKVMESCSKTLKRVTLELGGNDPAIICANVDVAKVAPTVAALALYNTGQVCIAIKRVYIHEKVYDDVLAAMAAYIKSQTVGDGFTEGTVLGPVQNELQFNRVKNLLEDIAAKKLPLAAGTTAAHTAKDPSKEKGYFITPTLVDNPPHDSRIVQEEPFGPVFPAIKWSDEDDVIAKANATNMGLGASVWTRDQDQAARISSQLKAGTVWVNTHMALDPHFPFGGLNESGLGAEFGEVGLKSYCNAHTVHVSKL